MIKNFHIQKKLFVIYLFFKRLNSGTLSLIQKHILFCNEIALSIFYAIKSASRQQRSNSNTFGIQNKLSQWLKTCARLASYPKERIRRRVRKLEKRTNQHIHPKAIGPGSELLSWFRSLHVYSDCNDKKVQLTKKQVNFVYALSRKLGTYPPQTIFQMLNSYSLVDAWFTISKILADYPFEKLKLAFENLSEKMRYPISPEDLLNFETMRIWLENSLKKE